MILLAKSGHLYKHKESPAVVFDGVYLTPRERDVLTLVVDGWTNLEIASELGVTKQTVRNYVHRLYSKLCVNNRIDLITRLKKKSVSDHSTLVLADSTE